MSRLQIVAAGLLFLCLALSGCAGAGGEVAGAEAQSSGTLDPSAPNWSAIPDWVEDAVNDTPSSDDDNETSLANATSEATNSTESQGNGSASESPTSSSNPTTSSGNSAESGNSGAGGSGSTVGDDWATMGSVPKLTVGDHWRFASVPGSSGTWWTDKQVQEELDFEYQGGMVRSYKVYSQTEYTDSNMQMSTKLTEIRRVDDLALLRDVSLVNLVVHGQDYGTVQSVRRMDTPCIDLHRPLVAGEQWTMTCPFTSTKSRVGTPGIMMGAGNMTVNYTVAQATETVNLASGTFTAVRLDKDDGDGNVVQEWYSRSACGAVKSANGNGGSFLEAYQCLG